MNIDNLRTEFDMLEEKTFDLMKSQLLSTEMHPAWAPEHENLNRYANITPSVHTLLDPYMNANSIKIDDFSAIAAQCPLPVEIPTLYRLFFEHIDTIVMLCNVEEGKVDQYYPNPGAQLCSEDFVIECNAAELLREDLILRSISISRNAQKKVIKHYELTSWPDLSYPQNVASFELLLQLTPNQNSFIHCSAGVGRTGSFILCRSLLHKPNVDLEMVNEHILEIRRQRSCFMVQSFEEYKFCYEYLVRRGE